MKYGFADLPVTLPCGRCVGCRLERSRQWAIRCVHEASLYENNCFITLTYNDANLPKGKTLVLRHFQLFMKRLRKKFGEDIRFYHCGEYGEQFGRPHYHACIFNHDFDDKKLWKENNGVPLYRSADLEKLWSVRGKSLGYSSVGGVTFQSAAYVARYIMKKITGDQADAHYEYIDEEGEIFQKKPEYTTMSRRPGIAAGWFKKFNSEVYPSDQIVLNNVKMKPPKFYDRQFEILNQSEYDQIKRKRILNARKKQADNSPKRLKVREAVTLARVAQLPRTLQ